MTIQFLSVEDILSMVTFSDSTLWRKVKAGTFPQPVRLSKRRVGWREKDVLKWDENLKNSDGTEDDQFTVIARKLADGTLKGQIILGGRRRVSILRTDERVVIERVDPSE